ncbi:MAG TPA: hypothetical protein VGL65_05150 [Gemmatimonadales bacterium]|jgi:hypothetical protein
MRRAALFLSAAALMVSAVALSAQTTNFAGKWTMVPDPNAATGGRGGGGGLGMEVTIAQDDKTLTTTRTTQNGDVKSTYNLDGSESTNTMSFGGNSIDQKSTGKWDGPKFTITTTRTGQNGPTTSTMALWLDASGNLMIASTNPPRGGGDPVTRTFTYKKN